MAKVARTFDEFVRDPLTPVTQKVPVTQQKVKVQVKLGLSHGGVGPCSARLWKPELRISRGVCCCRYSFCCWNSHHLLAAACGDPVGPEIAFANSFRGPLKKCTNRRPFKLAMQHNFLIFPRGE
jgi:hypothetical protein